MTIAAELITRRCQPCEGGVPTLSAAEIEALRPGVPAWTVTTDRKRLQRSWKMKNFAAALNFLNEVGQVAEAENHHPDLHLTGYRYVAIELTTHAIDGLSENDFILAAKIDALHPPLAG